MKKIGLNSSKNNFIMNSFPLPSNRKLSFLLNFLNNLYLSSISHLNRTTSTLCNSYEMSSRVVGHEVVITKCPLKSKMADGWRHSKRSSGPRVRVIFVIRSKGNRNLYRWTKGSAHTCGTECVPSGQCACAVQYACAEGKLVLKRLKTLWKDLYSEK